MRFESVLSQFGDKDAGNFAERVQNSIDVAMCTFVSGLLVRAFEDKSLTPVQLRAKCKTTSR